MPGHAWQKSSYCGQGEACVHIAAPGKGTVLLTESSDPTGAILTTTPETFATLLAHLKSTGDAPSGLDITYGPDGQVVLSSPDTTVTTTLDKWHAFTLGARAGEFDHFTSTARMPRARQ